MSKSKRKKLLACIVDHYIKTGNPIGSSNLIKLYKLRSSPSAVRNELNLMMKCGLLVQKHISSGRIPTEKGIRCYIDSLLTASTKRNNMIEIASSKYKDIDGTLDQVATAISSDLLSSFTHTACLVTLPDIKFMKIQSFKVVQFSEKKILLILVLEGGITEKTYIKLDTQIPSSQLNNISNYLNSLTYGLTLNEVKNKVLSKLKSNKPQYSQFVENLFKFSVEVCEKEKDIEVLINGKLSELNDNALDNLEVSKNLLHVFEHKDFLVDLLSKVVDENRSTKVFIGTFNGMPTGCSLIAAPYGYRNSYGSLGVFGPMRMDYSEIIPLVNYTAEYLSRVVFEGGNYGKW